MSFQPHHLLFSAFQATCPLALTGKAPSHCKVFAPGLLENVLPRMVLTSPQFSAQKPLSLVVLAMICLVHFTSSVSIKASVTKWMLIQYVMLLMVDVNHVGFDQSSDKRSEKQSK